MKLQLVQHFYGGGQCGLPVCDSDGCLNRGVRLWKTPEGKGLSLCGQREPQITIEQQVEFLAWQNANWKPSNTQPRPDIYGESMAL